MTKTTFLTCKKFQCIFSSFIFNFSDRHLFLFDLFPTDHIIHGYIYLATGSWDSHVFRSSLPAGRDTPNDSHSFSRYDSVYTANCNGHLSPNLGTSSHQLRPFAKLVPHIGVVKQNTFTDIALGNLSLEPNRISRSLVACFWLMLTPNWFNGIVGKFYFFIRWPTSAWWLYLPRSLKTKIPI